MAEVKLLREVRFDDPQDGAALARALDPDQPFRPGFDRCIAVTRGGKLLGGVIFDRYLRRSIQIHVAAFEPDWVTRAFLWVVADYCFNQLGVSIVYGHIASHNEKSLKIAAQSGFHVETCLPGAVEGGDLLIFSMYRADCRWLKLKPAFVSGGNPCPELQPQLPPITSR